MSVHTFNSIRDMSNRMILEKSVKSNKNQFEDFSGIGLVYLFQGKKSITLTLQNNKKVYLKFQIFKIFYSFKLQKIDFFL